MARRTRLLVVAGIAVLIGSIARAAVAANLCTLTGNLTTIAGAAAANTRVYFKSVSVQSYGGTIITPSSFSVLTDSQGNLPTTPAVTVPQGAMVLVTIGKGQPVQVQIPIAASADLATLMLANSDPPSLVSALAIASGGDFGLTATSPGIGAVGTATLTPGKVTALEGEPVSAALPTAGQFLVENAAGTAWTPETISGDVSAGTGAPADLTVASSSAATFNANSIAAKGISADKTGGPYAISGYNGQKQGMLNVMAYGASASTSTLSCTATSGSAALASCSVATGSNDFSAGQHVVVYHGGPAATIAAPTVTVTAYDPTGAGTNWSYQVRAVDASGGLSAPSTIQTVNNTASLRPDCFIAIAGNSSSYCTSPMTSGLNKIAISNVSGAVGYEIFGCSGTSCTPALIAVMPYEHSGPDAGDTTYYDMGTVSHFGVADGTAGISIAAVATADNLYTTVATAGANPTLAANLGQSGTLTLAHDDSPAIQNAIDSFCPGNAYNQLGKELYVPPGHYPLAQPLTDQGCLSAAFTGGPRHSRATPGPTAFIWNGPAGDPVILANQVGLNVFENFDLDAGYNSPGAGIDTDEYDAGGGVNTTTTANTYRSLSCGAGIAICLWFSDRNVSGNNENNDIDHLFTSTGFAAVGVGDSSAAAETYDWRIGRVDVSGAAFGFYMPRIGSFLAEAVDFGTVGGIGAYIGAPGSYFDFNGIEAESPNRVLVGPGQTNAGFTLDVAHSRLGDGTEAADSRLIWLKGANTVTLRDNLFLGGGSKDDLVYVDNGGGTTPDLFSLNNIYGLYSGSTTSPFVGNARVTSLNDRYRSASGTTLMDPLVGGSATVSGNLTVAGTNQLLNGKTTVSALPACNAAAAGAQMAVTDNNAACSYGTAPAGGGSTICPVFCDGTAWKIH